MADRHVDYALIGGGLAAASCAAQLREAGADGSILIVGREPDLPYHRPPCSKAYLRGRESRAHALVRPPQWYAEQRIEVLTRVSALKLDPSARTLKLSNRQEISFGRALVATGAGVRRLNVPGAELEGIHYLRTLGNSDAIRADAAGKRVVLIGGSYIASEVAATLTELGSVCTMVMIEPVALSRGFGEQAGRFFHQRLTDHGITVHPGETLARFEGAGGRVTGVVTQSGRQIEADAVVMGTGAVPDVMLARGAGLALGTSGGVAVDAQLRTSVPAIFAAGDMAEYDSVVHGRRLRVEHWDVAAAQGKTAALNMLGRQQPHREIPYFFSDLSDWASLEYVGPASDWDREVLRGAPEAGEFSVWYLRQGRLVAALSVGRPADLEYARELISSGRDLSGAAGRLADPETELVSI